MKGIIGLSALANKDRGGKCLEEAHELSELSAQREVDSEGNSFGNALRRKRRKETPSRGALLTPANGALFPLGISFFDFLCFHRPENALAFVLPYFRLGFRETHDESEMIVKLLLPRRSH